MKIEVEGQLTEKEHAAAQWLHLKPRPAFVIVGVLLVILSLVVLWLSFFDLLNHQAKMARLAVLVFLGYLFFHWTVVLPMKWRRIYRQQKSFQRPYKLEITDQGIIGQSENTQGTNSWNEYVRWKEGNGVFLLYWSDALFQVVPLRFFQADEQIVEFRNILREKVSE